MRERERKRTTREREREREIDKLKETFLVSCSSNQLKAYPEETLVS
jgi:hypothetical protein